MILEKLTVLNIFNTIKEKQNNSIASDTGDYVYIFDSLESLNKIIRKLRRIDSVYDVNRKK